MPGPSVVPDRAELRAGETQQVQVTGLDMATNEIVAGWILSPELGTIAENGSEARYTAPETVPASRKVTIIARTSAGNAPAAEVTLQGSPIGPVGVLLLAVYLIACYLASFWTLAAVVAPCFGVGTRIGAFGFPARDSIATLFGGLDPGKARELGLVALAFVFGLLGSLVHVTRSLVDFVGNRSIRSSWTLWYLLQPFVGAILAVIVYVALRGGVIPGGSATAYISPYGAAAMAALVGMFAKEATNKLAEVFTTLFKTGKGLELKDKLSTD